MLTRVGAVEIWRVLESVDPFLPPEKFFPDMAADGPALIAETDPHQICPQTGLMRIPIQGFLIKTPHHVILVDACVGNGKTCAFHEGWAKRSSGRFLAGLAAAGVSPAEVDYVLCTHLHIDHIGWNTQLLDGRWVPTFPNARYLFPKADDALFSAKPTSAYRESVSPVIAAGQAELVDTAPGGAGHEIGEHVTLIPTPGHTPGHVSVLIRGGAGAADSPVLITGDAIHATVQCRRPHWAFAFDHDPEAAKITRRQLLESAADQGHRVIGSHFTLPSLGSVRGEGDAFRWKGA